MKLEPEKLMDHRKALRRDAMSFHGVDRFPEPIPLNMRVLWKRTFVEYEEWKIEYDVETSETMPAAAGRYVPGYLLIPRGDHDRPLPGVVCFHQCGLDCVTGKEAVVGKVPWGSAKAIKSDGFQIQGGIYCDRADQSYGYELVHQGFVVLAPDSINCGERNIDAIRQEGQNKACFEVIDDQLGRALWAKHLFDDMRAVDLLQSLDFVDSDRIAAVGHSMGAGDVYDLMAIDDRVKAGIASGRIGAESARFLPLISPRLLVILLGEFDGPPNTLQEVQEIHAKGLKAFEEDATPENFVLLTARMGHWFGDEVKWKAFKRLKQHFGVLPPRTLVDLLEVVSQAREATRWFWEEDGHGAFPDPKSHGNCSIRANADQMLSLFTGLFLHLFTKGSRTELNVKVAEENGGCTFDCRIPYTGGDSEGASLETLREVERILAEHCTLLQRDHSDRELRYQIFFPKGSSDA